MLNRHYSTKQEKKNIESRNTVRNETITHCSAWDPGGSHGNQTKVTMVTQARLPHWSYL